MSEPIEARPAEPKPGIDREKLFAYREKRIHPSKDDKILTDWNGLMIAAFAKAAAALNDPAYNTRAKKAADFILKNLQKPDGRLMHRYRDGEAAMQANLDDYAFFTWGLIELYESTFEIRYLKAAVGLNQYQIAHFWDSANGGFFFTPDDGEKLLTRSKEFYDGAIPSGNSVRFVRLISWIAAAARRRPRRVPPEHRNALSANACRTNLPRPQPSAARITNSRCRSTKRVINIPVTLRLATNKREATAQNSAISVGRSVELAI